MCSSARAGPDNCTITTNNETLYIEVLAYDALNSVILTINGRNVAKVSEIDYFVLDLLHKVKQDF